MTLYHYIAGEGVIWYILPQFIGLFTDKDGAISEQELGKMMEQLGQPMSSVELKEFIDEIDIDGNGTIEFNEFLEMMVKKNPNAVDFEEKQQDDDIAIAFKVSLSISYNPKKRIRTNTPKLKLQFQSRLDFRAWEETSGL